LTAWHVIHTISETTSRWVKVIAEAVRDDQGNTLEYWRVEKDDSIIILPLYRGAIVLPRPFYRHGIGQHTWDLPGGRWGSRADIKTAALSILARELGISETDVAGLTSISGTPWPVNSAFSNQYLHGFVAEIADSAVFPEDRGVERFITDASGMAALLDRLSCLQCRCVVLEWLYRNAVFP